MTTENAPTWANVTLSDLLLSLQVPDGWEAEPEEYAVTLRGPSDEDYTPTVTLQEGEPEEPGHDWWLDFTEQIVGHLIDSSPGFELVGQREFRLSSLDAEVYAVTAHWESADPRVPETTQLQAWIWAGSTRMYSFSASTSVAHEERDLPVFDHMLDSVRLLPARP
ncbi:hypothetical protein P5P86_05195 [Nocardioides sp. BP30]|uniref:hypothetical protein n=1 Tax=Nocardioides sp. BP30 TaxID=3036374 RepID=UPI0024685EFE|nr:hypothetical protein [Nocardioides sp. BP30]WGL53220.1 hypothetical protein P5P86_05195 [Nocardioides sp. BP30]